MTFPNVYILIFPSSLFGREAVQFPTLILLRNLLQMAAAVIEHLIQMTLDLPMMTCDMT